MPQSGHRTQHSLKREDTPEDAAAASDSLAVPCPSLSLPSTAGGTRQHLTARLPALTRPHSTSGPLTRQSTLVKT